jgi:hypothetical protein
MPTPDAGTQDHEASTAVDGAEVTAPPVKRSGTYRAADGVQVPIDEAKAAWALAARERLIAAARVYQTITSYKDLAADVQTDTEIRTTTMMRQWIGPVLSMVAAECHRRGEPLLSALCVNAEGSVGPGYADWLADLRGETPADPDDHGARERLECYRFFGATMPADGGRPALAPTLRRRRDRAAAQREERRGAVCPTCFVELPVRGRCMNCDT